jgi:hypothetical protein
MVGQSPVRTRLTNAEWEIGANRLGRQAQTIVAREPTPASSSAFSAAPSPVCGRGLTFAGEG